MRKIISSTKLTDTLSITLCKDGYWLFDKTRCRHLSVRAKTSEEAFVEAITYYQRRLIEIESDYKLLKSKVDEVWQSI